MQGYVENNRDVLITKKPTHNKSALTQGDLTELDITTCSVTVIIVAT